jgi:mannosyl-3-phosphoglycerate phosphatase
VTCVLFTDVDGCLLDAPEISRGVGLSAGVRETVGALLALSVEIVFCSSKTDAELVHLQAELGLNGARIVENGAAIRGTEGQDETWALGWPDLDSRLSQAIEASGVDVVRLSSASNEQGEQFTGLRGEALDRARRREFTETLLSPLSYRQCQALLAQLATRGLGLESGTRFETIGTAGVDKGGAVHSWIERRRQRDPLLRTVGIGDGQNDLSFLSRVETRLLLRGRDGRWAHPGETLPGVRHIPGHGPTAWCTAVRTTFGL